MTWPNRSSPPLSTCRPRSTCWAGTDSLTHPAAVLLCADL